MMYSVDRIEGGVAVLVGDDESVADVSLANLPDGIRVGMMLRLENGVYMADAAAAKERLNKIRQLQQKLRRQ